jgi:hypothetical protein
MKLRMNEGVEENFEHLPTGETGMDHILLPDFPLGVVIVGDNLHGNRKHTRSSGMVVSSVRELPKAIPASGKRQ